MGRGGFRGAGPGSGQMKLGTVFLCHRATILPAQERASFNPVIVQAVHRKRDKINRRSLEQRNTSQSIFMFPSWG